MRGVLACTGVLWAMVPPAGAQQVAVEVVPALYAAERIQRFSPGSDSAFGETGVWYGGSGMLRVGRFALGAEVLRGELTHDLHEGLWTDAGIRVTRLELLFHPWPWLAVGPAVDVWRSTRTASALPRERITRRVGVWVDLSGTLGLPGLRGRLAGGLYPLGEARDVLDTYDIDQTDAEDANARAIASIEYRPPRVPILVRLSYRGDWWSASDPGGLTGLEEGQRDRLHGLQVGVGFRLIR